MSVGRGGKGGRQAGSVSDLHCEVVLVAAQERCGCYSNTVGGGAGEGGRRWEGLKLLYLSTIFRATCVRGCVCVWGGGGGGGGGGGRLLHVNFIHAENDNNSWMVTSYQ